MKKIIDLLKKRYGDKISFDNNNANIILYRGEDHKNEFHLSINLEKAELKWYVDCCEIFTEIVAKEEIIELIEEGIFEEILSKHCYEVDNENITN